MQGSKSDSKIGGSAKDNQAGQGSATYVSSNMFWACAACFLGHRQPLEAQHLLCATSSLSVGSEGLRLANVEISMLNTTAHTQQDDGSDTYLFEPSSLKAYTYARSQRTAGKGVTMLSNSFAYSQLPKRRRRSTPTSSSPTSPSESPQSNLQPLTSSDAPTLPSPKLENAYIERSKPPSRYRIPSFAESPNLDFSFDPSLTAPSRFSDEHVQSKPSPLLEQSRPSTSAAIGRETERFSRYFGPAAGSEPQSKSWAVGSPSEGRSIPSRGLWGKRSDTSPKDIAQHGWSSPALPASGLSPSLHDESQSNGRDHSRNISTFSLTSERMTGDGPAAAQKIISSRPGKGRLHLLNPMSLLARRRASQAQMKPDDVNLGSSSLSIPAMPEDYDPRIRGKIVHDFSAPRPRRIQSYQDGYSAENSPVGEFRSNLQNGRRASDLPGLADLSFERHATPPKHSPMFKEHFNDDRQALQPGNKGYLHSLAVTTMSSNEQASVNLPAFAKNLPKMIPEKDETTPQQPLSPPPGSSQRKDASSQQQGLQSALENPVNDSRIASIAAPTYPPPPIPEERHPPIPQLPPPPIPQTSPSKEHRRSHLPKHMTSTSSRFSFQLGGTDSAAQEKILEEKHKHQAALKASEEQANMDEEFIDDMDDDYNGYDMDGDDGLEERIPGVNADSDDDAEDTLRGSDEDESMPSESPAELDTFHFTPASAALSPDTSNATSQPTPRDESGQMIGFAHTTDSMDIARHSHQDQSDKHGDEVNLSLSGLGINNVQDPILRGGATASLPLRQREETFDDDMYFDDGEFDEFSASDAVEGFDEAIFDDESGRIRDIPAQNAKNLEDAQQRASFASHGNSSDDNVLTQRELLTVEVESRKQVSFAEPQLLSPDVDTSLNGNSLGDALTTGHRGVLTEGNLAAYHDALVSAANEAAANGRFSRQPSTSQASEDRGSTSQLPESHPGLVSDDSRLDLEQYGAEEDDAFVFDDDLDDDLMIAEANAEALENDEEGFYGQEFGFYARANGKNNTELVNGGFFGPRGVDGIKRSHSGKATFQEPSLTPITERSEWSTRNSVASLIIPGGPLSAHSVSSPAIAHFLDLDPANFDDDDMSLSALMKLRRGAWGGSSTSVNSLGGSHNGHSPVTQSASRDFAAQSNHPGNGHKMTSSVISFTDSVGIPEWEEEGGELEDHEQDLSEQMQTTPTKKPPDFQSSTPQSVAVLSPVSATSERSKNGHARGHSRTSSGAESISYVKDPEGSGRWVLERRRTGDDGELEIVGREYLAGARI